MINNILFYNSGGGVGDSIQLLPLLNTLKNELKNTKFYYLSAHKNHFNSTLKDFKNEMETIDLDMRYFGFRWWHIFLVKNKIKKKKITKFDLIIDLQSKLRNSIILKMIPHNYLISQCLNFRLSKPHLNYKKEKKIADTIIFSINKLLNENFKINDFDIEKIDNKFHFEAKKYYLI
jgi:hypothetical protein